MQLGSPHHTHGAPNSPPLAPNPPRPRPEREQKTQPPARGFGWLPPRVTKPPRSGIYETRKAPRSNHAARPVPAASRPLDFGVSSPSLPPSFQQHSGLPSPAFLQKTVGNPCQMPRMGPGVNAPGGRGHGDPFPLKPLSKLSQPLFLLRAGSQRGKLQLLRDLSEKVATCQEAAARPLLPQRQLRAGFLVGLRLFSPLSPADPIRTAREGWHSK